MKIHVHKNCQKHITIHQLFPFSIYRIFIIVEASYLTHSTFLNSKKLVKTSHESLPIHTNSTSIKKPLKFSTQHLRLHSIIPFSQFVISLKKKRTDQCYVECSCLSLCLIVSGLDILFFSFDVIRCFQHFLFGDIHW